MSATEGLPGAALSGGDRSSLLGSPFGRSRISADRACTSLAGQGESTDREVGMDELRALWAELKGRGELWNGMTGHYLRERYGDRLYHVVGAGWFVRAS